MTSPSLRLSCRQPRGMPFESDQEIRLILEQARRVAVIGIKDAPSADAYRIPLYLQNCGYSLAPVNPKFERVLDLPVARSLAELEGPIDLVNLFRAPEHIAAHTREILAMPHRPLAVWMQLGILCGESAAQLRAAGILVVQDRCIMIEHQRLMTA